jgi:hypothetical protein
LKRRRRIREVDDVILRLTAKYISKQYIYMMKSRIHDKVRLIRPAYFSGFGLAFK